MISHFTYHREKGNEMSNSANNQTIKIMQKSVRNKPINWQKLMRIGLLQWIMAALLASSGYAKESTAQSILSKDMTLRLDNVTLKEALGQIQKKTDVKFVYSSRVSLQSKIKIDVEHQKLSNVLDQLLTPRGISYKVINEQIVLASSQQQICISIIGNRMQSSGIWQRRQKLISKEKCFPLTITNRFRVLALS